MDWVQITVGDRRVVGTGWETVQGNLGDGPLAVALAALIAAMGALALGGVRSSAVQVVGALAGLGAVGLAIYEMVDVSAAPDILDASTGPGLWIILGSGALAFLGGLLAPSG